MFAVPVMLVAILLSGLLLASAQVTWPLVGQNLPPSGQVTTVSVDYLVDSIETINSEANSWTGHVWFHMQWTDPNAQAAIQNATNTWINGGTCNKACDWTLHQSAGCCDSLFVPHIDIPNVVAIKQESFPMYRFWLKGSDPSVVHWSQRISADFHSPFDFRAWPFEHQHLLVEMQIPPSIADRVTLVFGEATHLQNTPHTKGEVVTGWHIKSITRRMYDPSGCYNVSKANSTFFSIQPNNLSAGAVLSPLAYNTWAQLRQNDPKVDSYTTLAEPDCQLVGIGNTAEGLAQYGPRYLVIDTMVQRARNYYVLANLTPLILLAYMVFVTYAMERSDLEARMGVIVTLVLAVSALQFTYNFPPASYINTVQQITLMSYVLYFIVAIESMVTAQICRMHMRRRQHDQLVSVAHAPSLNTLGSGSLNNMKLPTTFEEVVEQANTNSNNQPRKHSGSGNTLPSVIVRPAVNGTPITLGVEQVPARTSLGGTVPGRPGPVAEGWSWCGDEANKDLEQPVATSFSGQESPDRASSSGVELKHRTSANKPARLAVPDLSVPSAEAGSAGNAGLARGSGGRSKWFPLTTSIMAGLKGGNQSVNNFGRTMSMHMNAFTERTSAVRDRITKDEAFAQLFASRMDNIFCWSLLVGYTITLAVLLWVNSQVGDHKLMLAGASKPANM